MLTANREMVDKRLRELGWGWNHERIVEYLAELSLRHCKRYTPYNLPPIYYYKLCVFLDVYARINRRLTRYGRTWKDCIVAEFMAIHSTSLINGKPNLRMHVKNWLELEKIVNSHARKWGKHKLKRARRKMFRERPTTYRS